MVYQRSQLLVAALMAATLTGTGCNKAPAVDDASLTAAVQSRLAADSGLSGESVQAAVQGGVVTLTGAVSNPAARSLAANDAGQVAGVRTVVNNLTVGEAPPPQTAEAPPPVAPTPAPVERPTRPARRERPSRAAVVDQPSEARASQPTPPNTPAPDLAAQNVPPPPPVEPPKPPAPTFRDVTLVAGSVVPVRITQTLDSATTQQGTSFSGTVASDVLADGAVVLPAGSAVSGRVETVQEAAHFKGNALLSISLTSITRRGQNIPVTTEAFSKEGNGRGKNTAEKVGGGAAVGAILGGILGGGKGAGIGAAAGGGLGAGANGVTRGQQVQIPSESLIRFRLTNAVTVRVRSDEHDTPAPAPDRRPLE